MLELHDLGGFFQVSLTSLKTAGYPMAGFLLPSQWNQMNHISPYRNRFLELSWPAKFLVCIGVVNICFLLYNLFSVSMFGNHSWYGPGFSAAIGILNLLVLCLFGCIVWGILRKQAWAPIIFLVISLGIFGQYFPKNYDSLYSFIQYFQGDELRLYFCLWEGCTILICILYFVLPKSNKPNLIGPKS